MKNPMFTDEPVDVIKTWLKDNADYIGVFKETESTYWVTLDTGGMMRIAEEFTDETEALDYANELQTKH